jgi:hypothetical protein
MIKLLLLISLLLILFIYFYFTRNIENFDSSSVNILDKTSLINFLNNTMTKPSLTTKTNIFNSVTKLDLSNTNLSKIDLQNTLYNLPELKIFDISNNNDFIGFQEKSFSRNQLLERIVINNPSFYRDFGKKIYISIDHDTNKLPILNKNNIYEILGINIDKDVFSYHNTSTPTPPSTTTTTPSLQNTTTPSLQNTIPSSTTTTTPSLQNTTPSLQNTIPSSLQNTTTSSSFQNTTPSLQNITSSSFQNTTPSLQNTIPPSTTPSSFQNITSSSFQNTTPSFQNTPSSSFQNITSSSFQNTIPSSNTPKKCNEFIQNCPTNLCNLITSESGTGTTPDALCINKKCAELDESNCSSLIINDTKTKCVFDNTKQVCQEFEGFKNAEHFQSSEYINLTDEDYLEIFQFVRKSDLINGINLNINECKLDVECKNNNECIIFNNNCQSCYEILKKYYETFYYYDIYNNEFNNLKNSGNIENKQLELKDLKKNELVKRSKLLEILQTKNILDLNSNLVRQKLENLKINDECYELKKLLTQNNLTCKEEQSRIGNIFEKCTSNINGCIYKEFSCKINNELNNNSVKYCLPYNMSEDDLELEQNQNKMINMLRKYPVSDCYNKFMDNSKL